MRQETDTAGGDAMLIWRQRLPVASTSQGTTKSTGRHQKLDETRSQGTTKTIGGHQKLDLGKESMVLPTS